MRNPWSVVRLLGLGIVLAFISPVLSTIALCVVAIFVIGRRMEAEHQSEIHRFEVFLETRTAERYEQEVAAALELVSPSPQEFLDQMMLRREEVEREIAAAEAEQDELIRREAEEGMFQLEMMLSMDDQ